MTTATTPDPQRHNDQPPALDRLLREAGKALSLGLHKPAEQSLDHALEIAPGNVEAHRLLGIAALLSGNHPKAIDNLRSALTMCPNDATIHMTLGSALFEAHAIDEGLAHLRHACKLTPGNAEAWCNLGVALEFCCFVLKSTDHMQETRDAFEHTVAIDPGHIKARNKLASVMLTLGDTAAAETVLRGTLSQQPDCIPAWRTLGNLKTKALGLEDVQQLRALLCRPGMTDDSRIPLMFTLAKALEDQSDYSAAFDTVIEANALKRRHLHWSQSEECARVDAIARAFTHPLSEAVDTTLGKEVIFVVCLPRSASTLTEQILASHSQVRAGGETELLIDILREESERLGRPFPSWLSTATGKDWQRLGETYLERIHNLLGQHPRFTDKSVDNWAYVGAALAMLPGAHVVNSRRNPLETCFACYRQLFSKGAHYSYDLDDMVGYYAGYDRLSTLWQQRFPQRYFNHSYESLQENMEAQIRRLLDFCELPFEPGCLTFHKARHTVLTLSASQVREPLRRDTARGTRYGAKLDPLRVKLRAAGIAVPEAE